jgi:adenylylsulfate kinase-like enzyme
LANQNENVIVSAVYPYLEAREYMEKNSNKKTLWVYLIYNEIRGRENFHIDYYEPPTNFDNAVEIDTTNKSVEQSFDELWKNLL